MLFLELLKKQISAVTISYLEQQNTPTIWKTSNGEALTTSDWETVTTGQEMQLTPEQERVIEEISWLQKELDGYDATKNFTGKAGSYLTKKLSPEDYQDPEARQTIQLLEQYKFRFIEATQWSGAVREKLNQLKQDVTGLEDNFEYATGFDANPGEQSKENRFTPEQLNTLSNKEFLSAPKSERLQHVTKNHIDYSSVASGAVSEVEFSFDPDGDGKDNPDLYKLTTAGQVFGDEVWVVQSSWVEYKRDGISGEFFNGNKRLIIHTGTEVEITKIRTKQELNTMNDMLATKMEAYNGNNSDIAQEALRRGINPEKILSMFSELLANTSEDERNIRIEESFTQLERIRDNLGVSADSEELFNSLKDENNDGILDNAQLNWNNLDFSDIGEWEEWLLEFISIAEGTNGNYDAIYGNGAQSTVKFSQMSLAEVIKYQKNFVNEWSPSSAIGKYQFLYGTLQDMVKKYGIDPDETFSAEMQDKLAILKMKERGLDRFKSTGDVTSFQRNLSKEWASLPKDSSGKSYYAWDGLNHALVKPADIQKQLGTFFS